MKSSNFALIVLFFILLMFSPLLQPLDPTMANAQSNSSCPSSDTLHVVLAGGAPNSFALLTAGTPSAFYFSYSAYYGVFPAYYPTGGYDYNLSLVDWISSNSNFTQWTFNVKPGLKWSNGQSVTSQDILATYSSKYAFNATYDFTGVHTEVTSENALNSSAAVFNLNKADAHFPETISQLVLSTVIPASMVNEYGTGFTGFESDAPVVGPFYPVNYQLGQTQMTLLRNPYFHPQPIACALDLTFVEATTQGASLLKGGAVDLAELDPISVAGVVSNPNIHILDQSDIWIETLDYNITVFPFNMTAFRQALVYGIDQSQIVQQALAGYGETAYNSEGTIPSAIANYYNPNQMTYQYNVSTAMALLNSIGMKLVNGHLQYPNGTDVTLTLWGDDSRSWDTIISSIIQTNLQQNLGIDVSTQLTTYGSNP